MPILLLADAGIPGEVVPIVAVTMTFVWLIVKALMAPFTQRASIKAKREASQAGGLSEEEHAALQDLQRTLVNMERRVESLETILIENPTGQGKLWFKNLNIGGTNGLNVGRQVAARGAAARGARPKVSSWESFAGLRRVGVTASFGRG